MSPRSSTRPGTATLLARAGAAEWTRLWTVRTTWWCLLAAAVGIVGMGALLGLDASGMPADAPRPAAWQAGEIALLPGQFALLVLVLLAVTSEYATGSITTTLQWTPHRWHVLLTRAVVPVSVATVAGVVLVLGADLTAWAIFPELELSVPGVAGSLAVAAGVLAAGGLLAVGAGLLLRSTAGALAVVFLSLLVLPFVLPQFGVQWMSTVATYLPGGAAMFLLIGVEPPGATHTTATAAALLTAWASGALLAGGLSFLTRDSS